MPSPNRTLAVPLCLLLGVLTSFVWPSILYANDATGNPTAPTPVAVPDPRLDEYGQLPLTFEPNQGQAARDVRYLSHSGSQALLLEQDAAILMISEPSSKEKGQGNTSVAKLKIRFAGANSEVELEPLDGQEGKSNYLLGNRPENWHTEIPNYARVEYRSLYPGVDLVFYGNRSHLEHDFIVAPGADYRRISLEIGGGRSVRLADDGSAIIRTAKGVVHFSAPRIYQVRDGREVQVAGGFRLVRHQLKFRVGAYDKSVPLIIDPVLSYSTYLTGSQGESGYALAVDSQGNAYVAGLTSSTDFPTKNPFQSTCNCGNGPDVFVSKLNSTGTGLIYSTYLGGSNYDVPTSIAIDGAGNAIVGGSTSSTDFPTKNPLTIHSNGNDTEGFITSLSPNGATLNFSTYLGGSGGASVSTVTTDSSGNIYAGGLTDAVDFPITPASNVIGVPPAYPLSDIFVAKLTATGSLVFASVIGPDSQQQTFNTIFGLASSNGIAVDSAQNIYIAGKASAGFPVTAGAFQTAYIGLDPFCGGCTMGFVAKLKPDGSAFTYATYLGGTGGDQVAGLAIDSAHNAFVAGNTSSLDFPTTPGAFQTTFPADPFGAQCCQTFVSKLDSTGSKLLYSTFLGAPASFGSGIIGTMSSGIAIDGTGDAFLTGVTVTTNFPVKNPLQTTLPVSQFGFGNDPATYVTELNPAGSGILFSTLFSGPSSAQAAAIATDHLADAKAVYITGTAFNDGLPTTAGAFQTTVPPPPPFTDSAHAFVTKFDLNTAAPALCPDQNSLFLFADVNTDSFPTTLNITNCGNAQLTITHIDVDGIFKETDTCQAPLEAGQKCVVTLTFHPTARGNFSGTLTIADNAPIQPTKFPIQATAVGPIVQLNTTQVILDDQLVGQTGAATPLLVFNQGDGLLQVSSVKQTGADFAVDSSECTAGPVQPGSACVIFVTFHPLMAGLRTGSVLITDNAPDSPQSATLQGTGITVYPVPSLSEAGPTLILERVDQQAITVSGSHFFPVSRIRMNGIQVATNYFTPSLLTATVPLNLIQNLGALTIDVLTPGPGGGISNSANVLTYQNIALSANDIVFEPYTRQIYASISANATLNPNTIVAVDPEKQSVGPFVPIGNNPDRLAVSEDGKFLYAGLDGDHAVQQFDIRAGKLGFLNALPNDPYFGNFQIAGEIHSVPGRSQDYVVSLRLQGSGPTGVSLVTNGVQRTALSAGTTQAAAVSSLCFLSDPSTFYGYNGTQIVQFKIQNNSSLQLTTLAPPAQPLNPQFACDHKYLYDYSGSVFDPLTNQSVGKYQLPDFSFGNGVIPETPLGRTYFLTYPSSTLTAFDQATFAQAGKLSFPSSISPFKLLRWGTDGFAFLNFNFTGGGDLVLIRSGLAQPSSGPNPKPRLKSVEPQVRQNNGNFQLTVDGKDFVPGAVVRWNNSDRSTIFVSDRSLIADIPNADVSAIGTAMITVFNPPSGGGLSNAISYAIREPILVSIAVTPDNPSIVKGKTLKFKATGTYSDATTKDLTTSVAWSSKTKKVATISATGIVSGIDTGTSVIEADSGRISASTVLTVYVGNFTEKLSKQSLTVVTGTSVSAIVTIAPVSGFSADVKLSAAGLPEGATASFAPEIVKAGSGTATLTISTTKATPLGLFSVTVTGAAGSLQHTTQLVLGINSSPGNFELVVSPKSITFYPGVDGDPATITIVPNGGFTGDVSLTVRGLPTGVEASFNPSNIVTGGSGTTFLFMLTDPSLALGTYSFQIIGMSGAIVNKQTVKLTIVPIPTN